MGRRSAATGARRSASGTVPVKLRLTIVDVAHSGLDSFVRVFICKVGIPESESVSIEIILTIIYRKLIKCGDRPHRKIRPCTHRLNDILFIKHYRIFINKKFHVATEIGSTHFWFSTIYRAVEIVQNDYKFIISMKFPVDRIPSCLIFEFWDSGRIMAVGH
jgi:hypothetical protein